MQASLRASSPGSAGMREGKGEDLIGQILTTQHQRSHRGSGGGIQMPETCRSKNALRGNYRHRTLDAFLLAKGKEREGFIKPNWCGRVLRLSILCYCKTHKKILIVCFFFVWAYACMSAWHAWVTGED